MQTIRLASKLILLAVMPLVSSGAAAGELGATSRASVAISVTIPPRLSVRAMHSAQLSETESPSRQFCVLSKGIETYSVTLLPSQPGSDAGRSSSRVNSAVVVAWSDGERGHSPAKVSAGTTVSGFRAGTPDTCQRGDVGAAELKMSAGDASDQVNQMSPLTLIIAAD